MVVSRENSWSLNFRPEHKEETGFVIVTDPAQEFCQGMRSNNLNRLETGQVYEDALQQSHRTGGGLLEGKAHNLEIASKDFR